MICLVVRHPTTEVAWDEIEVFDSFMAANQYVVGKSRHLRAVASNPDWCSLIVYEGHAHLKSTRVYMYSRDHDQMVLVRTLSKV